MAKTRISESRIKSREASDCFEITHKDGKKETIYAVGYKKKTKK